jgi:PTH1 family peptidyl-tRNA hydrolase
LKYLIVGLGNPGTEYAETRHNIGFKVLDALAEASNLVFKNNRLANVAEWKFKGRIFILIKPTTYMNLSGKAVNYWLQAEKIPIENLLVIVDDLALPFGTIRIKTEGSDGGHNGLSDISEVLGHSNYNRMRFGIGNNFSAGRQVDYVLGKWNEDELMFLPERINQICEAVKSFGSIGIQRTMNIYNQRFDFSEMIEKRKKELSNSENQTAKNPEI